MWVVVWEALPIVLINSCVHVFNPPKVHLERVLDPWGVSLIASFPLTQGVGGVRFLPSFVLVIVLFVSRF